MPTFVKCSRVFVVASFIWALCLACASSPNNPDGTKPVRSPADPWEPLNRSFYKTTRAFDAVTLKPIAKGYEKITPKFIRLGITNFSQNLRSPLNIVNHFLQGKLGDGFKQSGRLVMNTTLGLGGLLDVATDAGIEVKNEDFGQTLAVWGVTDGPYLFVPLLGPRTVRDATMIPLNLLADPLYHYEDSSVRDKAYLLRAINARQRLLSAEELLLEDAYDPYIRTREAYLQRRKYLIEDGEPPADEDSYDDLPDPDEEY